jgi:hypothetical protein
MSDLGDELAIIDKPLNDDDLISYILFSLDFDYNPAITMFVTKEKLTICEVYSQLLSFEQRLELQRAFEHYAHVASRGCGSIRGRGVPHGGRSPRGRGGRTGNVCGRSGPPHTDNRPQCQLCGKKRHKVMECWHRFNKNFTPNDKYAGAAATSYCVESNWYTDTGATDHVTDELEKLTVHDRYMGND